MQNKIKRSGAGGNPTHGHRKNNQLNYTTKMWRGQGVSEKNNWMAAIHKAAANLLKGRKK